MKYLLVIVISFIALVSFIAPIKSFRLPLAEKEPAPVLSFGGTDSKACTEKGVRPKGFPFRINLYDECEQNESIHIIALSVNVLFWISIASFTFIGLSKR